MASRAILQRKKFLYDSLNQPKWLVRWFSSFEHGSSSGSGVPYSRNWSWAVSYSSSSTNHVDEEDSHSLSNDEALTSLTKEFLRCSSSCIPTLGYGIGRSGALSPLGARWTIEYARYFSTAAAGQPELGISDDKNEEQAMNQKKEASPEECDQAVEGLSTVKAKAKAKAKQLQKSQKGAKPILKRMWAMLLGIGPALRGRCFYEQDWAKKLRHWKDEFKSTMQHYWLGTKLLWADVRISSRPLLKLARGKTLSRRERQQLTRTTADNFRLVPVAVFIVVPLMEFLLRVPEIVSQHVALNLPG